MTADDLSAPLGQQPLKRRGKFPVPLPHVVAAALAIFLGVFVLWALLGDDPFGGEPMVAVPIDLHAATAKKKPEVAVAPDATGTTQGSVRNDGAAAAAPPGQPAAGNTKTVTIIDGKTGARQEVVIPAASNAIGEGGERSQLAPPSHRRRGSDDGEAKLKGANGDIAK
jgi:uncharacterized protein